MGYSQTEFADKLNITNDWLSRLENGKAYPSRKLALKIAKELNVDFIDIFFNFFVTNNNTENKCQELCYNKLIHAINQ